MSLQPFLRAVLEPVRVTGVVTRFDLAFDGALIICPRLAWAARLNEFEWVEVRNFTRGTREPAHIFFGREACVAEFWGPAKSATAKGDELRVSAYAWQETEFPIENPATLVRVGRRNAPIEISRMTGRGAPNEPSFFPLPPRALPVISDVRPSSPALEERAGAR